jgi:sugar/nucleoside kinase (ribokinase family)
VADDELFARYVDAGQGLCIFTSGKAKIRYARRAAESHAMLPHDVPVTSSLGAGDTFRAGVVYGLLQGFSDHDCVRFASGLAALLCTRFPIADNVPSLGEVQAFLNARDASPSTN